MQGRMKTPLINVPKTISPRKQTFCFDNLSSCFPQFFLVLQNMEELAGISQKEFTDRLMSSMKLVAYVWTRLQAEKKEAKRHKAKEDRSDTDGYERFKDKNGMTVEAERCTRIEIDNEDISKKREWAVRLLNKLWKDIAPHDREHFVRSITGTLGSEPPRCVLTIGDHTSKMRRIDCFRQSNKVWRLDLICMVLFRGLPLESTDAERLGKHCNKEICLQPHHMYVNVREFDMVMAKVLGKCLLLLTPQLFPERTPVTRFTLFFLDA